MKLYFEEEAMRAEVLKYVSAGMPIDNARRIMEDSGFKCEDNYVRGPGCLSCRAVYDTHFLLADEISVSIEHESGKVIDVKVDCYCVGP
jgi:hypothetical protein